MPETLPRGPIYSPVLLYNAGLYGGKAKDVRRYIGCSAKAFVASNG